MSLHSLLRMLWVVLVRLHQQAQQQHGQQRGQPWWILASSSTPIELNQNRFDAWLPPPTDRRKPTQEHQRSSAYYHWDHNMRGLVLGVIITFHIQIKVIVVWNVIIGESWDLQDIHSLHSTCLVSDANTLCWASGYRCVKSWDRRTTGIVSTLIIVLIEKHWPGINAKNSVEGGRTSVNMDSLALGHREHESPFIWISCESNTAEAKVLECKMSTHRYRIYFFHNQSQEWERGRDCGR